MLQSLQTFWLLSEDGEHRNCLRRKKSDVSIVTKGSMACHLEEVRTSWAKLTRMMESRWCDLVES